MTIGRYQRTNRPILIISRLLLHLYGAQHVTSSTRWQYSTLTQSNNTNDQQMHSLCSVIKLTRHNQTDGQASWKVYRLVDSTMVVTASWLPSRATFKKVSSLSLCSVFTAAEADTRYFPPIAKQTLTKDCSQLVSMLW